MPDTSVVIITRNRPEMLERCLTRLSRQGAFEILVVDASDTDACRTIVGRAGAQYLEFLGRRGQMPASRNLAISRARGEILAFLDDDSMARPGWLEALVAPFADPAVGCVGGRAVDPAEPALDDPRRVGLLLADGTRVDNFNADPGQILEVDRVRGCNMAFRRVILEQLGGFDRAYTGSNVNEASDMCLRVKRAGHRVLYQPAAVVDHLSAPREQVPRDPRVRSTQFYLARNRAYLLLKTFGPMPPVLRTLYLVEPAAVLARVAGDPAGRLVWALAHLWGKMVGTAAALGPRRTGLPPSDAGAKTAQTARTTSRALS